MASFAVVYDACLLYPASVRDLAILLRLVTRSPSDGDRVQLDFAHLNAELNRPGVTLALLWGKHAVANAGQLTNLLRAGIV